jgi:hypothetical protein
VYRRWVILAHTEHRRSELLEPVSEMWRATHVLTGAFGRWRQCQLAVQQATDTAAAQQAQIIMVNQLFRVSQYQ